MGDDSIIAWLLRRTFVRIATLPTSVSADIYTSTSKRVPSCCVGNNGVVKEPVGQKAILVLARFFLLLVPACFHNNYFAINSGKTQWYGKTG